MLSHPVIDPTPHAIGLDPISLVAFVLWFATVVALARWRPVFGIVALVAAVPFDFARVVGPTNITLEKVALIAVIVGLAARRTSLTALCAPTARALIVAGAAVLLATAFSIASALHRDAALRETFKAVEYLALFATVVVSARAENALRGLGLAICSTVTLVSVLALLEELTGAPSGLWFHDRPIPRIAGPLEGPNQLAGYLGLSLCFVLAWLRMGSNAAMARIALGLGMAAEVLTISRAGLAAIVVGLATVIALTPRKPSPRDFLVIACGTFVGIAILAAWGFGAAHSTVGGLALVGHLSSTTESQNAGSVGTRSQLWHAAVALWKPHPFFGIGAGNFERELGLVGYPQLHTHANSLYLQALVEGGIPLTVATLALVATSIFVFARRPHDDPYVLAALAASIGFALHQSADLLVYYPKVGEMWWILIALGAARRDGAPSLSV